MGLPGLSMRAEINVEDKRLSIVLIIGYLLVFIYGIMNVFYHAEYFQYLPIAPVSQGGYVADDLGYDPNSPCTDVQNAHCADEVGAFCTVITPDEVVLGGTVYQDQLYITTKMDVLSHVKTCVGNVVQGMCVGICSEDEADRLTLYTAALEGLAVVNSHASKNPNAKDSESSTHHHCELKGSMALAPISSGPCADTTASLAFDGGMGNDGTCYEGDAMTVGQLLRNTDLGADIDEQLLGPNGDIKPAVRDSGAAVHVKIVYSNSPSDTTITYAYESTVIDRDPFVTARREMVEAGEWVEQSTGLWIRNETVLKRHGIAFTFSQEGLVGATNLNTLAVHLISIKGMIGVVVTLVTLLAKTAFKYDNKAFIVKMVDPKTNQKQVEVFNGHGHTAVPDPDERESDGEAKAATDNPVAAAKPGGDEF